MTVHVLPTAPVAPDALLPGDPGRALVLAQALLTEPKMSNHNRGLWGYHGHTREGRELTIQSTGMGGPSAAIVLHELIELGVRRAIRVGTCGALDGDLELGALVVAERAVCADGTSRALGAGAAVDPSPPLTAALRASSRGTAGPVVSTDLFYEADGTREAEWARAGAIAIDMEAATVFQLATNRGVDAACLLVVSDLLVPERRRIGAGQLEASVERMGRSALAALEAG